MTGDRPDGAALLAIAEQVLRRQVLPHVDGPKRLDALMVARAMAIAKAELADAGEAARRTEAAIAGLYGAGEGEGAGPDRLAADIRAGRFDAADQARALHAVLLADTERRLRIANPKYLDGR